MKNFSIDVNGKARNVTLSPRQGLGFVAKFEDSVLPPLWPVGVGDTEAAALYSLAGSEVVGAARPAIKQLVRQLPAN